MSPVSDSEDTAREFATRFVDGAFVEAADLLTEDAREALVESFPDEFQQGPMDAEDALEGYWRGLYGQYGDAKEVSEVRVDGHDAIVEFAFADGTETATVAVADGVAIEGFSFAPEYEAPDYADESVFSEHDVTVDAGDVAIDGVLAVPDGSGPFPAVLLVHGAGIHDPDGTAGASKILKDLAWGLATEGIAALRYEKRLHEHEVKDEDFTIDTVVTDDAVEALERLAAADEVAEDALFVAGHSQGGMCAPRIADRHGGVAGLVNLDGLADPIIDPEDIGVMRYRIDPDGDLDEEQRALFETQREAVQRIADGDFEDDEILLGKPGTWHRSVKDYDPIGTASSLDLPAFVLKTGRADEELQPELVAFLRDEFKAWRNANLADGSRVEFYEDLDHSFQTGPTPVTMTSLYFGGNVAKHVIMDLAEWIHGVASW